jgi:hypothetical protein
MELAVASVYLQGKQIFPFGAAHMQKGRLAPWRLEKKKTIVIHRHFPEISLCKSTHFVEIAEEPSRQVDQVHTLVDQLTPA